MIRQKTPRSRTSTAFRTDLAVTLLALAVDLMVWNGDRQLRNGAMLPLRVIPLTAVAAFGTLMLRRRYPIAVFVGQLGFATVLALLVPRYASFAGVVVALYAVALLRAPATSVLALVSCALPFGIQVFASVYRYEGPPMIGAIIFGTLATLPPVVAWGMGYRAWLVRARAEEMEARQQATTANALRLERLSIARELHDIIAHSVSVMVLQAAGAQAIAAADPARAVEAFKTIQDVGVQSMGELGRLLDVLRTTGDAAADRRVDRPDLRDLGQLLEETRAAGLAVSLSAEGTPGELDPSISLTAYRVVQEALTNTIKHGGAGVTARVHLAWDHQFLSVAVEDRIGSQQTTPAATNGLSTGHGLLGLRERVTLVGGSSDAHPIHRGFIVLAVLPLAGVTGRGSLAHLLPTGIRPHEAR